jgi:uncharacterized membrane protein
MLLCAVAALSVDYGRVFIARAEAQAYADSAALFAALRLDGSASGFREATRVAAANPNRYQFNTQAFPTPAVEFGPAPNGPWSPDPRGPAECDYVRVTATARVPMFLVSVFNGQKSAAVNAVAIAVRSAAVPRARLVR